MKGSNALGRLPDIISCVEIAIRVMIADKTPILKLGGLIGTVSGS